MEFAAKLRQSLPQNITGWETVGESTSLLDPYAMSIKHLDRRAILKERLDILLMRFTFGLDFGRLESHWQTEQD